eukprot:112197_1
MLSQSHKSNHIRVVARFRPSLDTERREEKKQALDSDEPIFYSIQEVTMKKPHNNPNSEQKFGATLDRIYKMSATQKKIFHFEGKSMVDAVLEGYNATILTYGPAKSGKTFTMFGPKKRKTESDLGLVQRCCAYLLHNLNNLHWKDENVSENICDWKVSVSFIQIYKDYLSDLLQPSFRKLQIREDFETGVPFIEDVKRVPIYNIEDFLINLSKAFSNRDIVSYKLNSTPSKSNMLLLFNVEQQIFDGTVTTAKLIFGDLMLTDDIRTELSDHPGPEEIKEAIATVMPITALEAVINNLVAYYRKHERPNYRASQLTRILQESFGGNCKTTMIFTVSPHVVNRIETRRVLRFATTPKCVENKPQINKELTRKKLMRHIEKLEAMNGILTARDIELKEQMNTNNLQNELSTDELYDDSNDDEEECKTIIAALQKAFAVSNHRANKLKDRNAELEKRVTDLSLDIEFVRQELHNRETINIMSKETSNFTKEIQILETTFNETQREISLLQLELSKQTYSWEQQIQQQRSDLNMKTQLTGELQIFAEDLHLQNEELLKQNNLLIKQITAFKHTSSTDNDATELGLLLDKFGAMEANDCRLTMEQRMKKTAKIMTDLSVDVNGMLEHKEKDDNMRTNSLSFEVRDLIHRFNALLNQMKSTKHNFQNDIKRKDEEILKLKDENKIKGNLQDTLERKEEMVALLKKQCIDLRVELNQYHSDSQTWPISNIDAIFLQNSARYLKDEFRSKDENTANIDLPLLDLSAILDGEEPPTSSDESDEVHPVVLLIFDSIQELKLNANPLQSTPTQVRCDSETLEQISISNKRMLQKSNGLPLNCKFAKFTELLVFGYIHELEKQNNFGCYVPLDMFAICCIFYDYFLEIPMDKATPFTILFAMFHHDLQCILSIDGWEALNILKQCQYLQNSNIDTLDKRCNVTTDLIQNQFNFCDIINISQVENEIMFMLSNFYEKISEYNYYNFHEWSADNVALSLVDFLVNNLEDITLQQHSRTWQVVEHFRRYCNHTQLDGESLVNHSEAFVNGFMKYYSGDQMISNVRKPREFKVSWRESLKPNVRLDCKDEYGLWWTAKVVAYKSGDTDKLQIRYDGLSERYDEIIDRLSDRLAVYKSMFYSKDIDGKKIIKEGFMKKEGKIFRTWRTRYFILDEQGKLIYYHSKGCDYPIGSIDIKIMEKVQRTKETNQFEAQIHTASWKFLCQNENDLAEWLHAFDFVTK